MQKTIMANGQRIATYYPITGRLQYSNGKVEHINKQSFSAMLLENGWEAV